MKYKAFLIIFKELSFKQIKATFREGKSPTFIYIYPYEK